MKMMMMIVVTIMLLDPCARLSRSVHGEDDSNGGESMQGDDDVMVVRACREMMM